MGSRNHSRPHLTVLLIVLMAATAALLLLSPLSAHAGGGSGPQLSGTGAGNQEEASSYLVVSGASTGTSAAVQDVYQGDYILVPVAFEGTGAHVSTVVDNASTTFTQVISSATNNDVELWCGQFTHATGGDKVTVTSSATATYAFRMIPVTGVTSCTAASGMTEAAHGSSSAGSVASFTPTTGDFCEVVLSAAATTSQSWTAHNPFLYIYNNANAPSSSIITGDDYIVDQWRGSWNANDGSTTATITGSSSFNWDEIIGCLPTSSAGNEAYVQNGPRGGARSSTNTPNEGVNGVLDGDYMLQFTGIVGTGVTVSSVASTSNLSPETTFSKAASSDTYDDTEIWVGQAAATSSGNPAVTDTLSGTCGNCVVLGWNIGGISSTTAQVFTNSGTASTVTIPSSTPNADDFCVAFAMIYTGTGSATFTIPGDTPWRLAGSGAVSGDYYDVTLMRPDWPSGVSTTAKITPSSTSSPDWDIVVTCFPGTVVVPLTCTMANGATAATVTLSESGGNSLSPTSATCNGSAQSITVDPSVTLTATEPAAGVSTRDEFSGGTTMTTDSVCASASSGQCSAWTFTNYEQLQNTYQASANAQATFDSGLTSQAVVGTSLGVGGTTICTIVITSGTSSDQCSGWSDYNTKATVSSVWTESTDYGASSGSSGSGGYDFNGVACATYSGYIYCVGGEPGFETGSSETSRVFYAPITSAGIGAWTETTDYGCTSSCASNGSTGVGVANLSCVVYNGYMYCVGGSGAGSKVFFSSVSSSGVGSTWTETTDYGCTSGCHSNGSTGTAVSFQACVASAGYIYCFGGYTGVSTLSKVFYTSLSSSGVGSSWTETTDYGCTSSCQSNGSTGTAIESESCATANGIVYCVAGNDGSRINNVYYTTLSSSGVGSTWTSTSAYGLGPVDSLSCGTYAAWLYCVGGWTSAGSSTSAVYYDSITSSGLGSWHETYDYGCTNACAKAATTGVSVALPSCATTTAGYIYCVGGYTASGSTSVSKVFYTSLLDAGGVSATISGAPSNSWWSLDGTCTFTQSSGGNNDNCNYYKQWQNAFQITAEAQSTFDSGLSLGITGTTFGSSAQSVCSILPLSSQTTSNCPGYVDNSGTVTFAQYLSGAASNTQWQNAAGAASTTSAITSGGSTLNTNYYKQLQNTFQVTAEAQSNFDTGMTWTITGTYLGTSGTTICTISSTAASTDSCTAYSDYSAAATFPASSSGAPSNSRWENAAGLASNTAAITTTGNTFNTNYYKQWTNNFEYTVSDASSPTAPALSCTSLGSSAMLTLTTSYQGFFCDNGATASATNPTSGSTGSERWSDNGQTFAISSGGANDAFNYYDQYSVTYAYTVALGGSPTVTNIVTYTQFGSTLNLTPTMGGVAAWTDAGTTSTYTNPIAGAAGERWHAGTASFLISSSTTENPTYTHQYTLTVNGGNGITYSVSSETGDNYWNAGDTPTVSSNGVWARSGGTGQRVASWNIDGGSNTNVATTGTVTTSTVTISSPQTVNFNAVTQYQLTFNAAATAALVSCSSPTITGDYYWYDSGTSGVGCTLNGVYGRSGGTGTRVTSYNWDGGANTPESTTGTFTTSSVTMSATHQVNANTVTQYQVTLDGGATAALNSITAPTVTGDNYWYDSGTSVTLKLNGVYGRGSGTGTRLSSYSINGGSPTNVATTGTVTVLNSISIASAEAVTTTTVTQYQLTLNSAATSALVSCTSPAIAADDYWYDSGTVVSCTLNGVYGRSGGTGTRVASYNWDGGSNTAESTTGTFTTSSETMNAANQLNANTAAQYQVTLDSGATSALASITAPTISGDNYWYDSGTSVTLTINGVYGRSGGSGTRITGYEINGGANNPVLTAGAATVLNAISIGSAESISTTTVTQYEVTFNAAAANALVSCTSPTIAGDNYWYDSGTTGVSCTLNGVYGRSGGSGTRVTSYNWDGGANTAESTTGTFATSSQTMSATHQLNANTATQYQVTLDAGASGALNAITPPTVSGDNYWYDSGTSVTLTLNGVYGRGSGTGTRLSSFSINGGAANAVATTGTVTVLSAISISSLQAITTTTVTQYQLTLNAVATSALVSCTNPTISGDNYWYDSGTSVSCTLDGVYGRSGGTGTRISSYDWDGGANTLESTTGTFATSVQTMSAAHELNANAVTQYQVTLDAGATSALASITSPTVSGDNYWYDSGTSVTLALNGVYGRAGGTGTRLTGYKVNGGANNPVLTTGTVTVLNAFSISSPQSITTTTVTQYQLTSNAPATSALVSCTAPTIAGDNYWYDSGTSNVSCTLNGVYGRAGGTGTRVTSYNWDGGSNTAESTTGTFTTSTLTMSATHELNANTVAQYQVTLDAGATSALNSISPPTIAGDNYWYDSGTSVTLTLNGVYGRGSGTGTRLSSYSISGGSATNVATTGIVTVLNSLPIGSAQSITTTTVTQFQLTLNPAAASALVSCTSPTISGDNYWYDTGTAVSCTLNGVYGRSGGTGTRISSYNWDGGSNTPESTAGTFTASSQIMTAPHQLNANTVTQYQVTLDAGATSALASITPPTISGDNYWYDSGTSVTVSLNGVYGRGGGSGTRVSSYSVNGGSPVNVLTTGTVSPLISVSISSAESITTTTVAQYEVTLDGGATSALASITSPTIPGDNYWYDSGTSITLTLNGVYGRGGGTGTRLSSYSINGGAPTNVATTSTVTVLGAISISSAQSIATTTVTQYQLTLNGAATAAFVSCTSPTISGDNYWYDTGTSVSCTLNGVYGRSGGSGTQVTSYNWDGGANNPESTTGAFTTSTVAMTATHELNANTATEYEVILDPGATSALNSITPSSIPGDNYWYESGTPVTVVLNGVYGRSGGTGTRLAAYKVNGGANNPVSTTGTVTVLSSLSISSSQSITTTTLAQYQVTLDAGATSALNSLTPPTIAGDNYWYDSGTSITLTLNGVYGRGAGTGTRLTGYEINGGANNPVSTTGTVTVLSAFSISAPQSITTTTTTQYEVTFNAAASSALVSCTAPTISGDNYWYDSGTAGVSCTLNGVYGRAGGVGSRITSYDWDGGAQTAETTTGTFTTSSQTMSATHQIDATMVTQYEITLDAGATASLNSITGPTVPGDAYWYDSGTLITVTLDGVYGRAGGTGSRVAEYGVNGGNNQASTTGTVSVLGGFPITSALSVTTTIVTQYQLTLNAAATSALVSCTSPAIAGDDYWYDGGTTVSCTLDGAYGRSGGTGTRVTSYNFDGGANMAELTTGTFATSPLAMNGPHQINANVVSQYEVTLDSGASNSLQSITPPTVPGDDYWYDSGTPVTLTLSGAFGRAGGTGERLTGYAVDGGASNPVSTTGAITILSALSISSPQTISTTTATQYEVTLDPTTTSALGSITPPTIPGDNYWYDSGTSVTLTLNGVWGRNGNTGNRLTLYEVDGGAPVITATAGPVSVLLSVPISSPFSITGAAVTQFHLTVNGGNGVSYSVPPPITGDVGWYDSGTSLTVSSNGVFGRAAGTGQRVSGWNIDGGANTPVFTTGVVTTGTVTMNSAQTVNFGIVTQYEVTLDATSTAALSSCSPPTVAGDDYWYDSGTAVTCSLNGVWGRAGGTGNRLTGYSLNGGVSTPESTTGTVVVVNVAAISSPEAVTATSVTQYQLTLVVIPSVAGTASYITPPTISGDSGWYDSGTSVSFTITLNSGYHFATWMGTGACAYSGAMQIASVILSCAATESVNFIGLQDVDQPIVLQPGSSVGSVPQFAITGCQSIQDSITGDGASHTIEIDPSCTFTISSVVNDATTRYGFSLSGQFSATSPDETTCSSGTCPTITLVYYEQIQDQFSYALVASGGSDPAPTLTCIQLGSSGSCGVLTGSAVSVWLDYGSQWSTTNPLSGSNSTARWYSTGAAGTASSSSSFVIDYVFQYLVSFASAPQNGGTTTPTSGSSMWVDSGSIVPLTASPNPGFTFSSWTASNPGPISIADSTAASTTATVTGPGQVTAAFAPVAYSVTFSESGLPAGTTWSVTVNGQTTSSSTGSLAVQLAPGSYAWNVSSLIGGTSGTRYLANPAGGQLVVTGATSQSVSYVTQYYLTVSVGSTASGVTLSPASGWYQAGTTLELSASAAASSYLEFQSWTGTGQGSYSGPNPDGEITMNGPLAETANFVAETGTLTFVETGLPPGAEWTVILDGVSQTSTTSSITFNGVPVGSTASWTIQSSGSAPETGSVQVASPETITVTVTFTGSTSTVTSTVTSTTRSGVSTLTSTSTSTSTTTATTTSTSTTTYVSSTTSTVTSPVSSSGQLFIGLLLALILLALVGLILVFRRRRRPADGVS